MNVLVVNNAEPEHNGFNVPLHRALEKVEGIRVDHVEYRTPFTADQLARRYGAVVLSGVPLDYPLDTIYDRAGRLDWLHDSKVPTLGICIGHQSMGLAFGAELRSAVEAESGTITINRVKNTQDDILAGFGASLTAEALHRYSISVPTEFELIARSDVCESQIIKRYDRSQYGMQFHPELSRDGHRLLGNFMAIAQQHQQQQ